MKFSAIAKTENPQSILLYGASKSGKTELASKLANEGYKLIWIDLENGKQTLTHSIKPENYDNVEYIHIPDTLENPVAVVTIGKLMQSKTPVTICESHGVVSCPFCQKGPSVTIDLTKLGPDTVLVIDTGTQLSDSALAYVMKEENKKMFSVFERADFDAYGHQGRLLSSIFSNFQQKGCHRILITHEEIIDQTDGSKLIMPKCGTRNYSRQFPRFFDHVVYCYRSNKDHKVASSTEFSPKILTGSRSAIAMEKGASLKDLLLAGNKEHAEKVVAGQAGKVADYGTPNV